MKKKHLYTLCECGVMIALATVLSFIEIQLGANGGSINFTMLPLLILAYRHGAIWGISSGLVFGFIKCLIGGGIGWGLPSVLLDYVLAYGAVGIAGLFKLGYRAFLIYRLSCKVCYPLYKRSNNISYYRSDRGKLVWRNSKPRYLLGALQPRLYASEQSCMHNTYDTSSSCFEANGKNV